MEPRELLTTFSLRHVSVLILVFKHIALIYVMEKHNRIVANEKTKTQMADKLVTLHVIA